jgi:thioredoxin-like negative regulator of GroEL
LQNKDPKILKPYLESSNNSETVEGILDLNRENYEKELVKKAFSVIEVYSKKCPGCKQIDPLIPQL